MSYAELGEWTAFCRRQGKKTANNYLTDRSAAVEWREDTVGVNHSHSPRLTDTTAGDLSSVVEGNLMIARLLSGGSRSVVMILDYLEVC